MDIVNADSPTLTSSVGATIVNIVKVDSPTLTSFIGATIVDICEG